MTSDIEIMGSFLTFFNEPDHYVAIPLADIHRIEVLADKCVDVFVAHPADEQEYLDNNPNGLAMDGTNPIAWRLMTSDAHDVAGMILKARSVLDGSSPPTMSFTVTPPSVEDQPAETDAFANMLPLPAVTDALKEYYADPDRVLDLLNPEDPVDFQRGAADIVAACLNMITGPGVDLDRLQVLEALSLAALDLHPQSLSSEWGEEPGASSRAYDLEVDARWDPTNLS